jgi:hypothetical protein
LLVQIRPQRDHTTSMRLHYKSKPRTLLIEESLSPNKTWREANRVMPVRKSIVLTPYSSRVLSQTTRHAFRVMHAVRASLNTEVEFLIRLNSTRPEHKPGTPNIVINSNITHHPPPGGGFGLSISGSITRHGFLIKSLHTWGLSVMYGTRGTPALIVHVGYGDIERYNTRSTDQSADYSDMNQAYTATDR